MPIAEQHEFQHNEGNAGPENMSVDNIANYRYRRLRRKLDWKTKWLIHNLYARYILSMKRVLKLFDANMMLVHTNVYAWANMLCVSLEKFFKVPIRNQLLRPYPKSMIKTSDTPTCLNSSTSLSWVPRLG